MAENVTLARPYAEAAFHLAKAGNALQAWSGVLSRLSAVAATPEMEECIGNPRLSATQVAQLCLDVAASSGKLDLSADQQNFVRVLADNDRLVVLPEISGLFDELKHAQEGVCVHEVRRQHENEYDTLFRRVQNVSRMPPF